jgi:hypothetical protein
MSLKNRLRKLEETWYTLEAEHYAAHWREFWEKDGEAETLREEFVRLTEASNPPYWFLPGKDDSERRFAWSLRDSQAAIVLFNQMHKRLKKFVDERSQTIPG